MMKSPMKIPVVCCLNREDATFTVYSNLANDASPEASKSFLMITRRLVPPNCVIMLDDTTVIPLLGKTLKKIDKEVRSVENKGRPFHVRLDLTGQTVMASFLKNCKCLFSVDLDAQGIATIGDRFLDGCTSLRRVELKSTSLTTIGDAFLYGCKSLPSLELQGHSLITIGDYFLMGCASLTSVDLKGNPLTTVGDAFLYGCKSLSSLELQGHSLTTIGDYFLMGCTSLTSVDLKGNPLTTVGRYFLEGCPSLVFSSNIPQLHASIHPSSN